MENKVEIVCSECSKPFISEDEHAEICPSCWEKFIDGDGKDAPEEE